MQFNNRLGCFIADKNISHLRRYLVHRSPWIDTRMLPPVAAQVLDGVHYTCFNNSQIHFW